jgi:hypothetical protein
MPKPYRAQMHSEAYARQIEPAVRAAQAAGAVKTYGGLAAALNGLGIPNVLGKRWAANGVRALLVRLRPALTADEARFIAEVEQYKGHEFTPQEVERYIFQARRIGDPSDESDLRLTAEEVQIVAQMEKDMGRKPAAQEILLTLDRARALGQI